MHKSTKNNIDFLEYFLKSDLTDLREFNGKRQYMPVFRQTRLANPARDCIARFVIAKNAPRWRGEWFALQLAQS